MSFESDFSFRIADMNGDGKKYMVVLGKSGTHILFNEG